jgi:COX assembly protein 1
MIPVIPGSTKEDEAIPRLPMPSRNPLPLSAAQESQVRELYHARVRGYCAKEIKGEVLLWWQVMFWEPRVLSVGAAAPTSSDRNANISPQTSLTARLAAPSPRPSPAVHKTVS